MIKVFTICSNNYLAQAITLGKTLLLHNPGYTFKICLTDRKSSLIDYSGMPFEITEVEDLGIKDWEKMILRYNIQELNTAVKPFFFNYIIKRSDFSDKIIYLDPDIVVYNRLSDLEKELEVKDIVVVPHITKPIEDDKNPGETDFLNTGLYNLGFIAITVSENSSKMIDWWSCRLKNKGYNDVKNGMFTDQLWINFVPLFFEKTKIFTHQGYNMAYWNLHERILDQVNNEYFVNEIMPLVFFHFSGFSPSKPDEISKYQNRYSFEQRVDILPLFRQYASMLNKNDYDFYQDFQCVFSGIKEENDDKIVTQKVRQIPIYKRVIKKGINFITRKFDIILDYRIFYER